MRALSRRDILIGTGSVCAAALLGEPAFAASKKKQTARRSADEWMSAWISKAKDVQGALYLGRFADPIYWLTKPIEWKPNLGQEQYQPVVVPIGFVTDFASIPQAFWSLLKPDGLYAYAAVIHDLLYWNQDRPRDVSDMIFKFAMQDFKVDVATTNTVYGAVRAFGGSAWDENARLKAGGEQRVLKRFPDDPRTRWAEWKKLPDVF